VKKVKPSEYIDMPMKDGGAREDKVICEVLCEVKGDKGYKTIEAVVDSGPAQ
jgi:hypothetical protein